MSELDGSSRGVKTEPMPVEHSERTKTRTQRRPASSVPELLLGATQRIPFNNTDSKSGAQFERVIIDGTDYVVKYLHADHDWIMRALGDAFGWPALAWASGFLDTLPPFIDHTIVGAAVGVGKEGRGTALLMRDVRHQLIPEGGEKVSPDEHAQFIDHMAALSAHFWNWQDDLGFAPYGARWNEFGPKMLAREASLGWPEQIPYVVAGGWARFAELAPRSLRDGIADLRNDTTPLVEGLRTTPSTMLHGDWKMGNLGVNRVTQQTILIDWSGIGAGPACHDLAWYIALNSDRLPISKEDTINMFQNALHRHGVDTGAWWQLQLSLSLLGTLVQFGWEKAMSNEAEFKWWCETALEGLDLL